MKNLFYITGLVFALLLAGCKKDSGPADANQNTDIPADPGGSAPATSINNITTIAATFQKVAGNESRVRMNLLGILHPVTGSPITFAANSSVWVTEDGTLKGIKVTPAGVGTVLTADVVFVVDNSGSMGQEADSIASRIIAFANYLQGSGLDVRVGCVGHGYYSDQEVYGALNLTTATALQTYLNRSSGLQRTVGFGGPDSAALATAASSGFLSSSGGENSVIGITFADSLFSWRSGANRVYVIFTDEPTQPGGQTFWSTSGLMSRWTTRKGTIHCVFSEDTSRTWTPLYYERPWDLATQTGGTMKFIPSSAAGLDLTTLPVTGALASSALIEFLTANPNAAHNVTVTVKGGTNADGKKQFLNITY